MLQLGEVLAALIIFVATYLFLAGAELPFLTLDRPGGAVAGAVAMVAFGVLTPKPVYRDAINWDTLVLLLGMMVIASVMARAAIFRWISWAALRRAHGWFLGQNSLGEGLADERCGAHLLCRCDRLPLPQPPLGGAFVERGDIELVHDEHAARLEQLREVLERGLESLDVVERGDGESRTERGRGLVQLVQRERTNVSAARLRIDREHVVAGSGELLGELAVARADLEQTHGRCGQGGAHVGRQVGSDHQDTSIGNRETKERR